MESKIKERLEGYESRLPEGDLAEFQSLLDRTSAGRGKARAPYAWLIPAAVAVGIALMLTPTREPESTPMQKSDTGTGIAEAVSPTIQKADTTPDMSAKPKLRATYTALRPVLAQLAINNIEPPPATIDSRIVDDQLPSREPQGTDPVNHDIIPDAASVDMIQDVTRDTIVTANNSSVEHLYTAEVTRDTRKPVSTKVGRASVSVLGSSALLALATEFPTVLKSEDLSDLPAMSDPVVPGEIWTTPTTDKRTGDDTYRMPMRMGLSLRIPFARRWSLTTGLEYQLYSSDLGYSLTGTHRQRAHYLGLPLRADYTIAAGRWMDVYVGAGASVDYCVAASDSGRRTDGDGVGLSLEAAGGIQFNLTRNLGLFLDPTLSWNTPVGHSVLSTYRSEHPIMFSVSSGIRVTLNGK